MIATRPSFYPFPLRLSDGMVRSTRRRQGWSCDARSRKGKVCHYCARLNAESNDACGRKMAVNISSMRRESYCLLTVGRQLEPRPPITCARKLHYNFEICIQTPPKRDRHERNPVNHKIWRGIFRKLIWVRLACAHLNGMMPPKNHKCSSLQNH